MILGPFLDSAKARSYPIWCVCVRSPSVLCCLLAPLLSSSVWLVVWCVLCFGRPPLSLLPPRMAGFSLVGCVLFVSFFCLDTEDTALHNSPSFSPWLYWYYLVVTKATSEVGQVFSAPPFFYLASSPLNSFRICFVFSCGLFLGFALERALLLLIGFCLCSERGGRFPVEPWTRLHCSELILALSS